MTLTLEEFRTLSEDEQLYAFLFGIHIAFYSDGDISIQCKQVGDFYVEFISDREKFLEMKSHSDTSLIERYLEDINIDAVR